MTDIFGKTLAVGQTVAACVQLGRQGYDMVPAEIVGFTPKMVRVTLKGYSAGRPSVITSGKLAVVS